VINDLLAMAALRARLIWFERLVMFHAVLTTYPWQLLPSASTTVSTTPEENGRDAVRLLIKRLNEPDRPREVITAEWRLVVRESTGPAPIV
jgi:DNA-binding LacI/PurR family transcriptional regulator